MADYRQNQTPNVRLPSDPAAPGLGPSGPFPDSHLIWQDDSGYLWVSITVNNITKKVRLTDFGIGRGVSGTPGDLATETGDSSVFLQADSATLFLE